MSVFTNPASGAKEQADAYIRAVLDLLGDDDPMEVLQGTPAALAEAIQGIAPERLARPEAPGKWSMGQVLQHLADSELVWAYRLRMVLAHERPTLTGYDQDLWAERLGYRSEAPEDAMDVFGTLRSANLRLLARATPADMTRVGLHVERGEESVRHMIRLYAGHDLVHRRQLARIRSTVA